MIITDEASLRVKCTDALPDEAGQIIAQLDKELLYASNGIGLAAPQIGIAKNVAIVRAGDFKINLVNAKIIKSYKEFIFDGEGCLSFPNSYVKSKRYKEIYVDNKIEPYSFIVTGLPAIVCQHELDHLIGRILPDIAIENNKIKMRPNDPCFCGSGKKYKKCCKK